VRVMSWVFDQSRSTGSDRLVLLAIADRADDDGTDAWPSVAWIARKARVSERTVQRSINTLVRLGELAVVRGNGVGRTSRYRVVMHGAASAPAGEARPAARPVETAVENPSAKGDKLTPLPIRRVTTAPTKGDTRVTRSIQEPSVNPPTPRQWGAARPHCAAHRRWRGACAECRAAADPPKPKPAWCGHCDQQSRLEELQVAGRDVVRRCQRCHPLTQPSGP
jgi:hypothetical protein